MESPPLVTLLRVVLTVEGLCCGLEAEEPPLLTGCATLVPVPEEGRLDDETAELPEVLVPVEVEPPLIWEEEVEPPLTWELEEEPLPACIEPEGRVTVDDERLLLPVEGRVTVAEEEEREEVPVVGRVWVAV